MRRKRGLTEKSHTRLFFLFLFSLTAASLAYGWNDEKITEEKKGEHDKNQLLVLPIVYYTPETRIAGGIGGIYYLRTLEDRLKNRPSTVLMNLVYTQRNQTIFEITPDLYLSKGGFHLVGHFGFKKYVEKFYGIGSATPEKYGEDFNYQRVNLRFSLRSRITPSFYAGVRYDYEHYDILDLVSGGTLESSGAVGQEGGTLSGLGVLLVRDNRDNIFFPTRGVFFQTKATLFSPAFGSDYEFQDYKLDFRQYMTLFSEHVLAFQQYISLTSGRVPLQRLSSLGGPSVMRGYIQGRFRDKHVICLQVEYRLPLVWRLSAAGFVGYGDVAERLKRFRFADFKVTGGLGIRYQINRASGTIVRLDFGFAPGSFGVYAMINEAF